MVGSVHEDTMSDMRGLQLSMQSTVVTSPTEDPGPCLGTSSRSDPDRRGDPGDRDLCAPDPGVRGDGQPGVRGPDGHHHAAVPAQDRVHQGSAGRLWPAGQGVTWGGGHCGL